MWQTLLLPCTPPSAFPFWNTYIPNPLKFLRLHLMYERFILILSSNSSFAFFLGVPVSEYFILFSFLLACCMFRPLYNCEHVDVRILFERKKVGNFLFSVFPTYCLPQHFKLNAPDLLFVWCVRPRQRLGAHFYHRGLQRVVP